MAATIASSSNLEAALDLTLASNARPCRLRANATRSASPKRSPICTARAAHSCASADSPALRCLWPAGSRQIALFDAILCVLLDQALRPAEPAARTSRLSAREQPKAQPERGTCGGEILARVETRLIHALLRGQHLLIARRQAGGPGKPVQVLGLERCRLVRERQRLEGVVPLTALVAARPRWSASDVTLLARDRSD